MRLPAMLMTQGLLGDRISLMNEVMQVFGSTLTFLKVMEVTKEIPDYLTNQEAAAKAIRSKLDVFQTLSDAEQEAERLAALDVLQQKLSEFDMPDMGHPGLDNDSD